MLQSNFAMQLQPCLLVFVFLFLLLSTHADEQFYRCSADCPQQTVNFTRPLVIPADCSANISASICLIDYRIDYDAEQIYLQFKATNDTSMFEEKNFTASLVQSLWLGLTFESNQPNITHRQYACRTGDECAREFYLKTIERLIRGAPKLLEKIQRKLSQRPSNSTFKRRCIDSRRRGNRTAILCPHGLCSVQHTTANAREQQCRRDAAPIFFSESQHFLPAVIPSERQAIEYTCNKHLCNRNETIEAIGKLLQQYTRWDRSDDDDDGQQVKKTSNAPRTAISFLLLLALFFVV